MSMNAAQAMKAYTSAARLVTQPDLQKAHNEAVFESFGEMVKDAVQNVSEIGGAAEGKAKDLASGRADIVELVTAVAETEVAVETMVTVRDRVISAYQDILNMPI